MFVPGGNRITEELTKTKWEHRHTGSNETMVRQSTQLKHIRAGQVIRRGRKLDRAWVNEKHKTRVNILKQEVTKLKTTHHDKKDTILILKSSVVSVLLLDNSYECLQVESFWDLQIL